MLQNKYLVKNLVFLFLGLLVSLVLGIYGIFQGFLVSMFTIIWFCYEMFFYKLFVNENKKIAIKTFDMENSVPFPYIILDNNKIIYANNVFKERFNVDTNKTISQLILNFEKGVKLQRVLFAKKDFILYSSLINYKNKKNSEIIFLIEPSYEISKEFDNSLGVIASLIFVDNYDEVIDTIEEIRRPLLTALIDRKINTLSQQVGGIVKKFEKDKYIFIFGSDKLDYLKERKFDILDKVREIEMGNKIPVTLSIGIGLSKRSLSESMEFARQSLDLALGRGGDQVLIKNIDKFSFFGGKSKEVDTNTRVRARVKAYAFGELIDEASDIIIMGHRNSDLDCLGSSIGVHTIARAFGKSSKIVLNDITTNINLLYDRIILEKEYFDNVFISSQQANEMITPKTLLVIVDSHRPSILESPELLTKASKIVVFDHHRKSTEFIDNPVLAYHEPYASSTCELVTEMLLYTKYQVTLSSTEADALLAGITVDTKNFAFKTGAKTFEAAAFLRRRGADSIRVRLLFQNKMESYKAKAVAVNNAVLFNKNMAISVCPSNIENPSLVTAQAADDLLNIQGIVASFVLCEENLRIIVSARSLGSINVQMIMEKLGGGGHQTVAGAQLSGMTLDKAMEILKEAVEKYIQEEFV